MKTTHTRTPLGQRFETACEELTRVRARVGWMESSKYPDGTPVAYVAAIQEYGAPTQGIPPRPFMRPTQQERAPAWAKQFAQGATACLNGRVSATAVMEAVSGGAADDIQKTISNVFDPPLSPVTLLLRKWRKAGRIITGATVGEAAAALASDNPPSLGGTSTKPLNDTGYMLATLTNEVSER